ncbi:MAG: mannonate dehydratase [Oscillospiraceae bacterium]|nr:mannonate dehydratase [Oscillospiraceae bacterium]
MGESKYIPGYTNTVDGIQVATKFEGRITRDAKGNLQLDMDGVNFLKQIGVEWVMVSGGQIPDHNLDTIIEAKALLEQHGLKIYCLHSQGYHNMPSVTLALEDRDEWIEKYLAHITRIGAAGIHYSTYAHMANGIWRNFERMPIRGGATGGGLDFDRPMRARTGNREYTNEDGLTHGREYTEDELWRNFEYFMKQVVPVAESAGVFIGMHPDDPPYYKIGGIPRCILGSFEGYKRAIEIANSPNIGVCLCVGCWVEVGTERMGASAEEFIRWLGERKKIFKLHVRNVTQMIHEPGGFTETYPDAGYYNLVDVIKALDDIDYDGAIINDHLIDMVGGHYACEAAFTSFLKGAVAGVQNYRLHK